MTTEQHFLLSLLRTVITGESCQIPSDIDWTKVVDLSFDQGVDALSVDGYHKCLESGTEESLLETDESLEDLKFEWFGSVLQAEEDSRRQEEAIASLAKVYSEAGIRMMVLKGYGLSLNYPTPSHRPTGDIDIYLFGDWKRGDELIQSKGIKIDYSHHHHSVFQWNGMTVENHYDIVNRYANRDGAQVDDLLKQLSGNGPKKVEIEQGAEIYLPSATFNGIFLLRHSAAHFSGDHITLRHLMDWALMVDKHPDEIDWQTVVAQAHKMGQLKFLSCLNALSIDHIGITADKFPELERDKELENRVLEDILHPTFSEDSQKSTGTISAFLYKLRRLHANRWKRDLVENEHYIPRMLRLAHSHLLRPEDKI